MSFITEWYNELIYNKSDPRTNKWFLVDGLGPLATIIAAYLYFCNYLGPRYMRDRKPYTLKNTLIVYNLLQVLLSIYMFSEGLLAGWLYDYSFKCQPVDYSDNPKALRMARGVYIYFIAKLIELLDTVFFVLRKKQRQITFLHLYHHAMMPVCAWIGVRFVPGGHPTLLGVINAFVHIVMYFYYMLSAFGPEVQKYLWWKKYLTSLQLVQFAIVLVHNVQLFFIDCNFSKILAFLLATNAGLFIYLFGSFYVRNYIKVNQEPTKTVTDAPIKNGVSKNNHHVTNNHQNNVESKKID